MLALSCREAHYIRGFGESRSFYACRFETMKKTGDERDRESKRERGQNRERERVTKQEKHCSKRAIKIKRKGEIVSSTLTKGACPTYRHLRVQVYVRAIVSFVPNCFRSFDILCAQAKQETSEFPRR